MSASKNLIQAAAGAGGGDFYPYTVDYSARFNQADDPYLYRTLSTTYSTYTFSAWVKLTALFVDYAYLFSSCAGSTQKGGVALNPSGNFYMFKYSGSASISTESAIRRDPSAWYHVVMKVSSGTASLHINGVQVLSGFSANSLQTGTNQTIVGAFNDGSLAYHWDGYMSEVALITGTAYDPTDFAEDKNGVWVPKDISGLTFGTDGFYLDFSNSAALGTDVSGNGNNLTSSGLTSSDQMIDTPTNNFATLPIGSPRTGYVPTVSEGNLKYVTQNSTGTLSRTGIPRSGVWYVEWQSPNCYPGAGYRGYFGLTPVTNGDVLSSSSNYWLVQSAGGAYVGSDYINYGTSVGTGTNSLAPGDIGSLTIDMDNLEITFRVNNSVVASGVAIQDVPHTFCLLGDGAPSRPENTIWNINFGQNGDFNGYETAQGNTDENGIGDFYYAPPSGALALCTANLPEPTIGPNSTIKPSDVFGTVLYTGNGTAIGSGGKTVDCGVDMTSGDYMVAIKNRDAADSWMVFDTVRGATKYIQFNSTNAEATDTESLTAFTATGVTLGNNVAVNTNTEDYVLYWFKVTAGFFDIQLRAGTGSTGTNGHDLGVVPKLIITRNRTTGAMIWPTYCASLNKPTPETWYLNLSGTGPAANYSYWNSTAPTSGVYSLSTDTAINASSNNYVDYLFADVEGFCKIGYFQGNGSSDGVFEYLGLSPQFHFWKQTNTTGHWFLFDTERSPYNPVDDPVYPSLPNAEDTNSVYDHDFVSNGVKNRYSGSGQNTSGGDYITFSIGTPFKYSNAR